jgi:hypothetical protein
LHGNVIKPTSKIDKVSIEMDTTPEHEPFSINHVDPRQAFTMSFPNSHIMTRLPIAEMTSWSIVHHTFSTIHDYRRPFITQHLCICQVVKIT